MNQTNFTAKEGIEGREKNGILLPVVIASAALGILLLSGVMYNLQSRGCISRG